MRRGRGLADTALEIGHRDDLGRQALGAVGAVILRLRSLRREKAAQAQHLVQGEPLGAALGFRTALGQIRIGLQHPAEMRLGHRDQIAGDLPGREQAQRFAPGLVHAAAGQVGAAAGAGGGDLGKAFGAGRRLQLGQGGVGIDVEIGWQPRLNCTVLAHASARCAVFWPDYHKTRHMEEKAASLRHFSAKYGETCPALYRIWGQGKIFCRLESCYLLLRRRPGADPALQIRRLAPPG